MDFKLEVCVDSVESAMNAQEAGAHRVELCNNLPEGGTTPGYGTIVSARNNLTIGLHVIIRPRGGDFLYTDLEYDIMRRDIEMCLENSVDGIVIGILEKGGAIDLERTARLIELAGPMSTTFHRAFDMCADPQKGLEDVISAGASRLLTSGQKQRAEDGVDLILELKDQADSRIIIMPGSGINESNIAKIAKSTKTKEFHLSGRKIIESEMIFKPQDISMSGAEESIEFTRKVADTAALHRIIKQLDLL